MHFACTHEIIIDMQGDCRYLTQCCNNAACPTAPISEPFQNYARFTREALQPGHYQKEYAAHDRFLLHPCKQQLKPLSILHSSTTESCFETASCGCSSNTVFSGSSMLIIFHITTADNQRCEHNNTEFGSPRLAVHIQPGPPAVPAGQALGLFLHCRLGWQAP